MKRVALLVPCRDEADLLPRKLRNLASLRLPPGGPHRVVVVDDHSRDGTFERVEALASEVEARADLEVRVVRNRHAPGKAGALRTAFDEADGCGLLLVTDADVVLDRDALARIVEQFEDPRVGAVTGEQRFVERIEEDGSVRGRADSLYDRATRAVRRFESRRGAVFSVHGQCLALRSDLALRPTPGLAADDLDLALRARLAGRRVVYAEGAVFHEEKPGAGRDRQDLRRAKAFVQFVARRWRAAFGPGLRVGGRFALLLYFSLPFATPLLVLGTAAGSILLLGPVAAAVALGAAALLPPVRGFVRLAWVMARAVLEEASGRRVTDRWERAR